MAIRNAYAEAGTDRAAMRCCIVKSRGYAVVGVAKALGCHGETLIVMPLIRHWMKVRDDAFDNRIMAGFERGECLGVHASDERGEGTRNVKHYNSNQAQK